MTIEEWEAKNEGTIPKIDLSKIELPKVVHVEREEILGGLTKLEYFSGLAMQNIQNVLLRKSGQPQLLEAMKKYNIETAHEVIAREAVEFAKALIKELEKEQI